MASNLASVSLHSTSGGCLPCGAFCPFSGRAPLHPRSTAGSNLCPQRSALSSVHYRVLRPLLPPTAAAADGTGRLQPSVAAAGADRRRRRPGINCRRAAEICGRHFSSASRQQRLARARSGEPFEVSASYGRGQCDLNQPPVPAVSAGCSALLPFRYPVTPDDPLSRDPPRGPSRGCSRSELTVIEPFVSRGLGGRGLLCRISSRTDRCVYTLDQLWEPGQTARVREEGGGLITASPRSPFVNVRGPLVSVHG